MRKPLKLQALIVRMLERVQPVGHDLEMLVFLRRQFGDNYSRLAFEHDDKADGPAGNGVGDEELLAGDLQLLTYLDRRGSQSGEVRAGTRFGQGERRQGVPSGEARQEASLLLLCAERLQRVHRADAAVDRSEARDGTVDRSHLPIEAGKAGERCSLAAIVRRDEHSPVARGGQLVDGGLRCLPSFVANLAGGTPATHHIEAAFHGGIARMGRGQGRRGEKVKRYPPVPHRAVGRTGAGAMALGEQRLNLFIRSVHRSHAAGFFFALAAQAQRCLGEAGLGRGLFGDAHGLVLTGEMDSTVRSVSCIGRAAYWRASHVSGGSELAKGEPPASAGGVSLRELTPPADAGGSPLPCFAMRARVNFTPPRRSPRLPPATA